MFERLSLLKELLAEQGLLFLHCDSGKGHHLRCLLDEVFSPEAFRNELIWYYENKLGTGGSVFDSRHDTLYVYAKGKAGSTHHPILLPVKNVKPQPVTQKVDGKRVWLQNDDGKLRYEVGKTERPVGDVWTVPIINPVASERTGYPTQKPEQLLHWIIGSSSNPGDIVLDAFIGAGTTAVVAQKLGRRWIGCDINKGAIQLTAKKISEVVDAQSNKPAQRKLEGLEQSPEPTQLALCVFRVNNYDLQVQHNEAVKLACDFIGVETNRSDSYFDGVLGKALVKVIPFNHPLSPVDLDDLRKEMQARPDEHRDITLVCLGMESSSQGWIDEWNRLRKRGGGVPNRLDVIELRSDPNYAGFLKHDPARAKVAISRQASGKIKVVINDFISPTIIKRLDLERDLFQKKVKDWRSMVDCVMVDPAYDGTVFNAVVYDAPSKKSDLVAGEYDVDAPADKKPTFVAVKIVDMLGEEVLISGEV